MRLAILLFSYQEETVLGILKSRIYLEIEIDVVNIRTPQHEIFICVSQTLILRLDGRRGLVRDCNDSILSFKQ